MHPCEGPVLCCHPRQGTQGSRCSPMLRADLSLPGDQPETPGLIPLELGGVGKQARAEPGLLPFFFVFSLVSSTPPLFSFIEENTNLSYRRQPRLHLRLAALVLGARKLPAATERLPELRPLSPRLPFSPLLVSQCPSPRRRTAPPSPPCP